MRPIAILSSLVVLAAACIRGEASPPASPALPSISREPTAPAATFDTKWPIKHVVFLIKENRSFDHMFGRFPGVDGVTEANDQGTCGPSPGPSTSDRTT